MRMGSRLVAWTWAESVALGAAIIDWNEADSDDLIKLLPPLGEVVVKSTTAGSFLDVCMLSRLSMDVTSIA